jgi:uncharacterized protein YndB with AHSA1/START domain
MGPISASSTVDAPREVVFDLVTDFSLRPAFTDHFQHDLHLERVPPRGVGAAARFRRARGRMWFESAIERVERPHLVVERGKGGRLDRIRTSTVWEIHEGPGAVNTITVTHWTEPGGLIDRVRELGAGRWHRRQWRTALGRLAELAESGADDAPRVGIAGGRREPTGVP